MADSATIKTERTTVYVGSVRIRSFERPVLAFALARELRVKYGMPSRTLRELVQLDGTVVLA
jgi:hypothetical protein